MRVECRCIRLCKGADCRYAEVAVDEYTQSFEKVATSVVQN